MSKHRKRWTSQEKLEIVNYYKQNGLTKTKREFEVSSTSIYNWEELYDEHGSAGLSGKRKEMNLPKMRRLSDCVEKMTH